MRLTKILLILGLLCVGAVRSWAVSFDVPPDSEIYSVLEELAATGAIQSDLWGLKPLSQSEVARLLHEAQSNSRVLSPYLRQRLLRASKRFFFDTEQSYFKPIADPYLFYTHVPAQMPWEDYQGRTQEEDALGFGFQSRWFFSKHLLLHASFEAAYLSGEENFFRGRFLQGYVKTGGDNFFFSFGVNQVWWGQAETGNLLFSLNSPPFTSLWKAGLEQPILLPWYFRLLGPFKFVFFAARLGGDRVVPHPWLLGLKVAFKPHPRLEIDLDRSIMCGGENRRVSLSKILFGIGENVEGGPDPSEGDQKAGFEIRFRPLDHLMLYTEAAGEDEAGGFPSRWAYIYGLYAPGLWQRVGLRLEYAYITKWWYHHHVYRSGYTYKGWLLGYYTDRTTRNYFAELTYDLTPDWRVGLATWQEKHYDPQVRYLYRLNRYELTLTGHLKLYSREFVFQGKLRLNQVQDAEEPSDGPQVFFKISMPF